MEDISTYLGINRTFSLICCIFCILSLAEGKTISEVVGSRVILHCNNESIGLLTQLTWKMNEIALFSFIPQKNLSVSPTARTLNVNMSKSESQLYALIIERVQTSHTGNYTCETNTGAGPQEQKWELIITESAEGGHWDTHMLVIAVAVPCVCCLIFIIALTILLRICKRRKNSVRSPPAEMEQAEDIYENCLDADVSRRRGYNHRYKHRAC